MTAFGFDTRNIIRSANSRRLQTSEGFLAKPKKTVRVSSKADPNVGALLRGIDAGKSLFTVPKGSRIFSQGDQTDAIYFIENGKIKISVVSTGGKEAVLAILGPQGF